MSTPVKRLLSRIGKVILQDALLTLTNMTVQRLNSKTLLLLKRGIILHLTVRERILLDLVYLGDCDCRHGWPSRRVTTVPYHSTLESLSLLSLRRESRRVQTLDDYRWTHRAPISPQCSYFLPRHRLAFLPATLELLPKKDFPQKWKRVERSFLRAASRKLDDLR